MEACNCQTQTEKSNERSKAKRLNYGHRVIVTLSFYAIVANIP